MIYLFCSPRSSLAEKLVPCCARRLYRSPSGLGLSLGLSGPHSRRPQGDGKGDGSRAMMSSGPIDCVALGRLRRREEARVRLCRGRRRCHQPKLKLDERPPRSHLCADNSDNRLESTADRKRDGPKRAGLIGIWKQHWRGPVAIYFTEVVLALETPSLKFKPGHQFESRRESLLSLLACSNQKKADRCRLKSRASLVRESQALAYMYTNHRDRSEPMELAGEFII